MKPECKVTGNDGNIFAILARVDRVLRDADQKEKIGEMRARVMNQTTYFDAIGVMEEYVKLT